MISTKELSHTSQFANGQKIRELRFGLGLTQLELAMRLDCSERLVRKMEKNESVSFKSLSNLYVYLKEEEVEVDPRDLIWQPDKTFEVAEQWFKERFIDRNENADRKWFSKNLALSNSTISKLRTLAQHDEISIGTVIHHEQDVAIKFIINKKGLPSSEQTGAVWLNVIRGEITKLELVIDVACYTTTIQAGKNGQRFR